MAAKRLRAPSASLHPRSRLAYPKRYVSALAPGRLAAGAARCVFRPPASARSTPPRPQPPVFVGAAPAANNGAASPCAWAGPTAHTRLPALACESRAQSRESRAGAAQAANNAAASPSAGAGPVAHSRLPALACESRAQSRESRAGAAQAANNAAASPSAGAGPVAHSRLPALLRFILRLSSLAPRPSPTANRLPLQFSQPSP